MIYMEKWFKFGFILMLTNHFERKINFAAKIYQVPSNEVF